MKRSDKFRLIADLIDEGADFEIKSVLGITSVMKKGLEELDFCHIEEPIRINDEERFLLKRFASKYKRISRNAAGMLTVSREGRNHSLPNVFFELFNFLDENESYVIEDLLIGKVCKIHR